MPSSKPKRKDAIQTRSALLAAAGAAFAQHGFRNAKIRKVCADAGVNLGAVSHYFGSKEALYREVLILAHGDLREREPVPAMQPGDDPAAALCRWVDYLLRFTLIRRASHPYVGPILAREIREPSSALDELVATFIEPIRQELARIVGALLGSADAPGLRQRCTMLVLGLCVTPELGQEVFKRLGQPAPRTEEDVAALARTVAAFALGGIERLASGRGN